MGATGEVLFAERSHVPESTLEQQFPGFKACFGGEELRRAQAALTCSQVGGTIEALLATDLPPSLARLSSLGRNSLDSARPGSLSKRPSGTPRSELPQPASPMLTRSSPLTFDPQQAAAMELSHMGQQYQHELERLGVLAPVPSSPLRGAASWNSGRLLATAHSGQLGASHEGPAPASTTHRQAPSTPTKAASQQAQSTSAPQQQPEQQEAASDTPAQSSSAADPSQSSGPQQQQAEGASSAPEGAGGTGPPAEAGSTATAGVAAAAAQDTSAASQSLSPRKPGPPSPITIPENHHAAPIITVRGGIGPAASAAAPATAQPALPADPLTRAAAYEAAYAHGLVLHDLAARSPLGSPQHLARLQEACDRYRLAVRLRPTAHIALYNWGVALADLAQAIKQSDPASARVCLEAAAARYAQALAVNADMHQALNNWGLVLQELAALSRSKQERDMLLRQACTKFRQAIRLRPDFDRACYNLGTVLYGAACMLQGEVAAQAPAVPVGQAGPDMAAANAATAAAHGPAAAAAAAAASQAAAEQREAQKAEVGKLFMSAGQYICLAFALQQHQHIYRQSLSRVRDVLRLPFLRVGYLSTPVPNTRGTPEEAWRQDWFVLDASSLRSATGLEGPLSAPHAPGLLQALSAMPAASASHSLVLSLSAISHVARLRDPTLPPGGAFCVALRGAQLQSGLEVVMVAEDDASADVWVDMLMLAAYVVQSRATEALADALMPIHAGTSHT